MLAQGEATGSGAFTLLVLIGLAMYLIPTIAAVLRKVSNSGSVAVINILLGWTLIGWVTALAMAARSSPSQQPYGSYPSSDRPL